MKEVIGIGTVIKWLIIYIIICGLIPFIIKRLIFDNFGEKVSAFLDLINVVILNIIYINYLITKYNIELNLFNNINLKNILISIACAILFFVLLDNKLDPLLDKFFVSSTIEYNKNVKELFEYPIIMFIQACLLAPIIEEILIRGIILDSLRNTYSTIIALIISTILFAILHFNLVQALSAIICGFILGLIYINTESLFCCILTHALYNFISYISVAFEKKGKTFYLF